MRPPCRLLLGVTAMVMFLLPTGGWGADPVLAGSAKQETARESPARFFAFGKQNLGIALGYGFGLNGGVSQEVDDVQYIYVAPRWGIGISDPKGGDAWYRGNFELVLEGAFMYNIEPKSGFGAGATGLIRYNFLPESTFIPFVELGGSLLYIDMNLDGRPDGFNFAPQGGVGWHYFVSERTAVTGELRFQHISNAGIESPNVSINSLLFLMGFSIFLQ
jgi:lipid A 3-O-deacylase